MQAKDVAQIHLVRGKVRILVEGLLHFPSHVFDNELITTVARILQK